MARMNLAFIFEDGQLRRSSNLILQLALLTACSFFWTSCSTLSQSSTSSSQGSTPAPQGISIQSALPSASVGVSYQEVLSVSGGLAPYHFFVSQGVIPPGLALNSQTGSISGIPTQAGTFAFTIGVTGGPSVVPDRQPFAEPSGMSGTRPYTMIVSASGKSVTVQISPLDPSVAAGGKVQFAAVVSNTSNTAVIWSASAGSISAQGLFTAPASTSAKLITVTASSAAQSAAQASAAVAVTSSQGAPSAQFTITTSYLPNAVEAQPYSTTLTASGGQPPYQWSVVSGSLPAGLQLSASTGTLSGTAAQSGTFTFSVRGTDAASHTAQQSLSLVVSTSGQTCGPPVYCSRTDVDIVQMPSTPPNVGNLSGANTVVTDPNFGNRIVRITDANTDTNSAYINRTYVSAASGSADENLWNLDSTLLVLQDSGAQTYPFTFNPSTMQAARMYVSSFPATGGLMLPEPGDWSRVNPNFLYAFGGTTIGKYDFTNRAVPPSQQTLFDFTSSPNCLPAGFSYTWKTKGGVSSDDTVFAAAYSNTGLQDTGVYATAYKVGSGCTVLNTQTGEVWGDWGAKGTISMPDRWTVHNVKLSKDGNWLVIAVGSCLLPACSHGPFFWQIGTTNVSSCGEGGSCDGHWTEGYTHWVNNNNTPISNQVIRLFPQASSVTNLTHSFPPGFTANFDQHQSWNDVDPADSVPFASTTWSPTTPFPAPWYNEIIAVAADGSGTTWRFAHSFNSTQSPNFSTQYAIGSVSQDGKFFLFSSDWMGELGSVSGSTSCTISTNCRGDVFVVELR